MNLKATLLALSLGATTALAALGTTCNPTKGPCDPIRGTLALNKFYDFRRGKPDNWTMSWWGSPVEFGPAGAVFKYTRLGDSPSMWTDFYIEAGRVEFRAKVAPGQGIITNGVLWSDVLDELDWEFSGNQNGKKPFPPPDGMWQVQSNAFTLGRPTGWKRWPFGNFLTRKSTETFHTYGWDWDEDHLDWLLDGHVVRHYGKGEFEPRGMETPMKLQIGLWAGGDPNNGPGTKRWAGGEVEPEKGPFEAIFSWVNITQTRRSRTCQYKWISDDASRSSYRKTLGPYGVCYIFDPTHGFKFFEKRDGVQHDDGDDDGPINLADDDVVRELIENSEFTEEDIRKLIDQAPGPEPEPEPEPEVPTEAAPPTEGGGSEGSTDQETPRPEFPEGYNPASGHPEITATPTAVVVVPTDPAAEPTTLAPVQEDSSAPVQDAPPAADDGPEGGEDKEVHEDEETHQDEQTPEKQRKQPEEPASEEEGHEQPPIATGPEEEGQAGPLPTGPVTAFPGSGDAAPALATVIEYVTVTELTTVIWDEESERPILEQHAPSASTTTRTTTVSVTSVSEIGANGAEAVAGEAAATAIVASADGMEGVGGIPMRVRRHLGLW